MIQEGIRNKIAKLASNPYAGKTLKGNFDGMYVIRYWPYRIIFDVNEKKGVVRVLNIGHRRNIYESSVK